MHLLDFNSSFLWSLKRSGGTATHLTQKNQHKLRDLKKELALIQTPQLAQDAALEVMHLLDIYTDKRSLPVLPLHSQEQKKESYLLKEIESMAKQRDLLVSQTILLHQIHAEKVENITLLQETLANIKLQYLQQPPHTNAKLFKGLSWMKAEVELAIALLNEERMAHKRKQESLYASTLNKKIQYAFAHLNIPQKRVAKAKEALVKLKHDIKQEKRMLVSLEQNERLSTKADNAQSLQMLLLPLNIMKQKGNIRNKHLWLMHEEIVVSLDTLGQGTNNFKQMYRHHKRLKEALATIRSWAENTEGRIHSEINTFKKQVILLRNESIKNTLLEKRKKLLKQTLKVGELLDERINQLGVLLDIFHQKLLMHSSGTQMLFEKGYFFIDDYWVAFKHWSEHTLFQINAVPITPLGLLMFTLTLFTGWFMARAISYLLLKSASSIGRGKLQISSAKTLSKIIQFIIMGIVFLLAVSNLGIDITKLTILISALSIGIGFGLQTIISNFVSGIILMFERSIKVGDYIELENGTRGEVQEINIRSTIINTNDNIDILVPNAEFINKHVVNWTMKNRIIRLKIPFSVAYHSEVERVNTSVLESASKLPYTLNIGTKYMPQLWLTHFAESALAYELIVWIKPGYLNSVGSVKSAYNLAILQTLRENNIDIPYPQREIKILHN